MNETYSILAPYAVARRRFNKRGGSNTRWLTAMACLVLGVPLALAASLYLLSTGEDSESGSPDPLVTAQLALPSLPSPLSQPLPADQADMPPPPDMVAVSPEVAPTVDPGQDDPSRRIIRLAWGDTLLGLLVKAAVPEAEAHEALASLKGVYDPRDIQAGEEVVVRFDDTGGFHGFEFEPAADRTVRVERRDGDYEAASIVRPLSSNVMAASVRIDGSLYESGIGAGIPAGVMAELVRALSFSVDFQRDIQPGNSFRVMYEVKRNPEGEMVRTGDILYAEVRLNDRTVPVYRFRFADGRTEMFDRDGKSVRRALMRTPINAARISSGFGMRRHPILGYSKMHKGVDFAAPTGTPIYAAGDGVIVERGFKSGYGNYIRLRHNGTLQTAYAHMSRFNTALGRGSRVRQGQVIGYVGSTGASTGPHLHFEVLVNGAQVNPLRVANLRAGEALSGAGLERLRRIAASIDEQFSALPDGMAQDVSFSALTGEAVRPAADQPAAPVVQAKRLNN